MTVWRSFAHRMPTGQPSTRRPEVPGKSRAFASALPIRQGLPSSRCTHAARASRMNHDRTRSYSPKLNTSSATVALNLSVADREGMRAYSPQLSWSYPARATQCAGSDALAPLFSPRWKAAPKARETRCVEVGGPPEFTSPPPLGRWLHAGRSRGCRVEFRR